MSNEIDKAEITSLGQTKCLDPLGRVYKYKDQYIRVIKKSKTNYVKKLFASGLIDELIAKGYLTECFITDLTYDGKLIVSHKKIEPTHLEYMPWCFGMIKAAADLILNVNAICNRYGYQLLDCHYGNVLFEGIHPIYIDLGSIVKWDGKDWRAMREFFKFYVYPLHFWSGGYKDIVFSTLWSCELTTIRKIYVGLFGEMGFLDSKEKNQDMDFIKNALSQLQCDDKAFWTGYQDGYWGNGNSKRFQLEKDWISEKKDIESMLELGANSGYFSWFIGGTIRHIKHIIATDSDWGALNNMYEKLQEDKEGMGGKITPLFLDMCWRGDLSPLKSDLVVANALTHHLIFTEKMPMDTMVEIFDKITRKYLIVEFMPRGMAGGSRVPKWYTLEWFLDHISTKFIVEEIGRAEYGRVQILAKKRCENG